MKKLVLSVALLTSVSANAAMTSQTEKAYSFIGDKDYAGFCQAVVQNDVKMLKAKVARKVGEIAGSRKNVVKRLVAENGVTCNGASLVEFSKQYQADDVHAYLSAAL